MCQSSNYLCWVAAINWPGPVISSTDLLHRVRLRVSYVTFQLFPSYPSLVLCRPVMLLFLFSGLHCPPLSPLPFAPWLTASFRATGRSGVHGRGQRINISSRSWSQSSNWAMHNHEFNPCPASSFHKFPVSQLCTPAKHAQFLAIGMTNLEWLTSNFKSALTPNTPFSHRSNFSLISHSKHGTQMLLP